MIKEQAELLAEITGAELREEYSGRGMFGKTTDGIIVDDMSSFFYNLGNWMKNLEGADIEEIKQIGSAIQNLKTDNMGTQTIIY